MADTRENWVDIHGYEGCYQVSDLGRVKSLGRMVVHKGITYYQAERIMSPWSGTTSTYLCVRLYRDGMRKKFSVHRLVAELFLEGWNANLEVNHKDGNRFNNAAENLEMCTHQYNMQHAILEGLKNDCGEKSSCAKLTNAQAEEIRNRYGQGGISQTVLGRAYGVSRQTVSMIVRYKKYIR